MELRTVIALIKCLVCEKQFTPRNSLREKLCSEWCKVLRRRQIGAKYRSKHPRTPEPRDCGLCGATFQPRTRVNAKYCTPKCYMRVRNIGANYKISLTEYRDLLTEQKDKCAGCLEPFGEHTPRVDHDHQTGKVRGLLHSKCNSTLGFVDDDPDKLESLAEYLRRDL